MGMITAALHSAHQHWRTQGLQNRGLLVFLIEADNSRHLDVAARDQVLAEMSSYTHVRGNTPQSTHY